MPRERSFEIDLDSGRRHKPFDDISLGLCESVMAIFHDFLRF